MMELFKGKKTLLAATALALPACFISTASADVGATLTFTTDYVFRGVSFSDEDPAIQGSMDWWNDAGVYAGLWATSWDGAGANSQTETDWYVGWAGSLGAVDLDVMGIYYYYPGADSSADLDWGEVWVQPSIALGDSFTLGAGLFYTPEYSGDLGDGLALSVTGTLALPGDVSLVATYGNQDIEDFFAPGNDIDYDWYSIGLSKEINGFGLDLSYYDTNNDCDTQFFDAQHCDGRAVFTVSRSM
jgi:uncharacterized protein (TIGR02001 family)